jgi:hypothetical protein
MIIQMTHLYHILLLFYFWLKFSVSVLGAIFRNLMFLFVHIHSTSPLNMSITVRSVQLPLVLLLVPVPAPLSPLPQRKTPTRVRWGLRNGSRGIHWGLWANRAVQRPTDSFVLFCWLATAVATVSQDKNTFVCMLRYIFRKECLLTVFLRTWNGKHQLLRLTGTYRCCQLMETTDKTSHSNEILEVMWLWNVRRNVIDIDITVNCSWVDRQWH